MESVPLGGPGSARKWIPVYSSFGHDDSPDIHSFTDTLGPPNRAPDLPQKSAASHCGVEEKSGTLR